MSVSRRKLVAAGCGLAVAASVPAALGAVDGARSGPGVREAAHWVSLSRERVQCKLCPRECTVGEGARGHCGVRENRGGKYYTLVYGRPCAAHNDPIEKKPLFHFLPDSRAFSIGTAGCNIECLFCQNWNISQAAPEDVETYDMPPEKVLALARGAGCEAIAHTYSEPTVSFEYMLECARLGREGGIPVVMISNGFILEEPMRELAAHLGAVKIDLKSFSQEFYSETCNGSLQPVLDTLKVLKSEGVWFEIVVLLVTGLNDSADEIKRMAAWVVGELSPDVPVHFSRYFPRYKLTLPQTPVETMQRAYHTAKAEGCNFVYVGNISMPGMADTLCPGCGEQVIKRLGMMVRANHLDDGKCPSCGRAIPGVWKKEDAFKRDKV